jgi:hypothetical protein
LINDGYARVTYIKDTQGRDIETTYFGTNGNPVEFKQGYAQTTCRYNDYGDLIRESYFDASGEPVLNKDGIASVTVAHDNFGRAVEWEFFGGRGQPVLGAKDYRYHRKKHILDERGNRLESMTFGLDGRPIEVADPTSGRLCAKVVRRFDANNKEIKSECFDAAGKLEVPKKK